LPPGPKPVAPKIENARDRSPWRFPDAFAVHRIMHRPVRLCGPGCRVSSSPFSPVWPGAAAQVALHRAFRIVPATKPRVAPALQSFCRASGWIFESPRVSHPSAWPCSKLPGCPGSLLRALPPMSVRVAPFARSSGCTGDGGFRVAPNLSSFGGTVSNSPGRPGSSLLQPLPLMNRRVAPGVSSSGFAGGEFFRLPRSSSPSAVPIGGSPSFPGSAAFRHLPFPLLRVTPDRLPRRVDDESPLRSNFASPVYPADVSPGCPKVASTGCAADESSNSLGSCFPAYTAMFP
jgi:hypothetical protein